MAKAINPFVIRQLAFGRHFANREHEVGRMASALQDAGAGLLVYGHRRLGKSSALEQAARRVRDAGGHAVIASLTTATDPADAGRRVLEAVHRSVGRSGREILESIAGHLSARLEVQLSSVPGEPPSIRLGLRRGETHQDGSELLPDVLTAIDAEMGRRGILLGIGLDEFQRIHDWGGEDAEWALREAIQRHGRIGYVLAGSERGMIEAMVADRHRAFWKLFDIQEFGAIDEGVLRSWIRDLAQESGQRFSDPACSRVVELAYPRTRDVVQLARETWSRVSQEATPDMVEEAFEAIVDAQGAIYQKIWSDLSATQQRVLRVVAAGFSSSLTARDTLDRFQLGPKSTVHQAAESLVRDEHLVRPPEGGFRFDDPFFERWVQRVTLEDIGLPVPPLAAPRG